MIDAFLNSVEAPVSDDEDSPSLFHNFSSCTPISVKTVVIACKPLTAVVDRVCSYVPLEDPKIGSIGVSSEVGFICLNQEIRFNLNQLFCNFEHVVVLTDKFVSQERCVTVVDANNCSECYFGLPACIMTQSLMKNYKCTLLVAKHPSIHPNAEDAVNLAENLALHVSSYSFEQSDIITRFNMIAPINRKVPLYS